MKFLKKLVRTRQREQKKLLPLVNGAIDLLDLLHQGGHISCNSCGRPWFEVFTNGDELHLGCTGCHWEGKALLVETLDYYGDIRCEYCECKQMALVVSDDTLSIGCRKCEWDIRSKLNVTDSGIIIP